MKVKDGRKRKNIFVIIQVMNLAILRNYRRIRKIAERLCLTMISFRPSFEATIILHTLEAHSIIHSYWSIHIYFGRIFEGTKSTKSISAPEINVMKPGCQNTTDTKTKTCPSYPTQLTARDRRTLPLHRTTALIGFKYILHNSCSPAPAVDFMYTQRTKE